MHLALPNKRSSIAPIYSTRSSRNSLIRRRRIQVVALFILTAGIFVYILTQCISSLTQARYEDSSVVIVTVIDHEDFSKEYMDDVKENRINYAKKHGYITFFPNISDYDLDGAPKSWARVPATRHAFAQHDRCKYVWYLNHNSVIMNPSVTVNGDIMNPSKLESLMLRNQPIVPPNSVIKTFKELKGANIDLVITQDKAGLAPGSFIVRRGCWSKFFLDIWFDPLYRSYNFQKAHIHALEHIVQWHPTILSKLALIPQKMLNSYRDPDLASEAGAYSDGDFVVELTGCEQTGRDCAAEARPYLKQSKSKYDQH